MAIPNVVQLDDLMRYERTLGSREELFDCFGEDNVNLSIIKSKGANVSEGFVLSRNVHKKLDCSEIKTITEDVWQDVLKNIHVIEDKSQLKFGDKNSLFFNVKGVIPTCGVQFVGMNDFTVRELEKITDKAVAYNAYCQLIKSYGTIVLGVPNTNFEYITIEYMRSRNIDWTHLSLLQGPDYFQLSKLYKGIIVQYSGKPFPQDPNKQLRTAIAACFAMTSSLTGQEYASKSGTCQSPSVLVQRAYLGNMTESSYAVAFSNYNNIGTKEFNGIFARQADLDSLVNGITEAATLEDNKDMPYYLPLQDLCNKISENFIRPMNVHVIIQNDTPVIISLMSAMLGGPCIYAAFTTIKQSGISSEEIVRNLRPSDFVAAEMPTVMARMMPDFVQGISGAYGAATGAITTSSSDCIERTRNGEQVILFKGTFAVSDITAMASAAAVVCTRGGEFSEVTRLVRSMGLPAAIACTDLAIYGESIATEQGELAIGDQTTVTQGGAYHGPQRLSPPLLAPGLKGIIKIMEEVRGDKMKVLASAFSSVQIRAAIDAGADGIGAFNLEHVFSGDGELIIGLVADREDGELACKVEAKIEEALSQAIDECEGDVTVELIDHPIDTFLPSIVELTREIARLRTEKEYIEDFTGEEELMEKERLLEIVHKVQESNPVMGLRGARINIVEHGLFAAQVNAIQRVAESKQRDIRVIVPFTTYQGEIEYLANRTTLKLGASISTPRACLTTATLGKAAEFIRINVDELQETLFGMNAVDVERGFLKEYLDWGLLPNSPFTNLDEEAAGELITTAVAKGKKPAEATGRAIINTRAIRYLKAAGVKGIVVPPEFIPLACLCATQSVLGK